MVVDALDAYGPSCLYCPGPTADEDLNPHDDFVLAHYPIAHADGGPFTLENVRPAHRECNLAAGR